MCWSVPLIDTWSTIAQPLIDNESTFQFKVREESTDFGLMFVTQLTLGTLSTDYWSSVNWISTGIVDQESIKIAIECQLQVD